MIACIDIGPRPLIAIRRTRNPDGTPLAGFAVVLGEAASVLIVSSVTEPRTPTF
jgi:hypothetical protein